MAHLSDVHPFLSAGSQVSVPTVQAPSKSCQDCSQGHTNPDAQAGRPSARWASQSWVTSHCVLPDCCHGLLMLAFLSCAGRGRQATCRVGAVAAPETFKVYEKQLQISKGSKVKVKH